MGGAIAASRYIKYLSIHRGLHLNVSLLDCLHHSTKNCFLSLKGRFFLKNPTEPLGELNGIVILKFLSSLLFPFSGVFHGFNNNFSVERTWVISVWETNTRPPKSLVSVVGYLCTQKSVLYLALACVLLLPIDGPWYQSINQRQTRAQMTVVCIKQ